MLSLKAALNSGIPANSLAFSYLARAVPTARTHAAARTRTVKKTPGSPPEFCAPEEVSCGAERTATGMKRSEAHADLEKHTHEIPSFIPDRSIRGTIAGIAGGPVRTEGKFIKMANIEHGTFAIADEVIE